MTFFLFLSQRSALLRLVFAIALAVPIWVGYALLMKSS